MNSTISISNLWLNRHAEIWLEAIWYLITLDYVNKVNSWQSRDLWVCIKVWKTLWCRLRSNNLRILYLISFSDSYTSHGYGELNMTQSKNSSNVALHYTQKWLHNNKPNIRSACTVNLFLYTSIKEVILKRIMNFLLSLTTALVMLGKWTQAQKGE